MAKKKNKKKRTIVKTKENKTKRELSPKQVLMPEKKKNNKRQVMTQVLTWLVFIMCVAGYLYGLNFTYEKFEQQAEEAELIISRNDIEYDKSVAQQDVLGERITADEETEANLDIVAQTSEPSDEEVDSVVDQYENERKTELREKINLKLPDETDNPNYAVTFVEPNEDGVEIKVDDNSFDKVQSPYLLPSLSIGKHNITFRFQDENDVTQTFTETVIVIPRPPEFTEGQDLSFTGAERVRFEGTALPNSKIVLLISSKQIYTEVADVDVEGSWSVTFNEEFNSGDHKLVGFVRKDGYASNFSEALNFTVGETLGADSTLEVGDAETSMTDDIVEFLSAGNNLYWTVGILSGLIILGIILVIISRRKGEKKDVFDGGKKSETKTQVKDESSIPLREKFAKAGLVSTTTSKSDDSDVDDQDSRKDKKSKKKDKTKKEEKEEVPEEKEKHDQSKKSKTDSDKPNKKTQKDDSESEPEEPKKKDKGSEPKQTKEEDDESKPEVGKVYSKEEFLNEFKDLDDDGDGAESSDPEESADPGESADEQDDTSSEDSTPAENEEDSNQSDQNPGKNNSSSKQKNTQSDSVDKEPENSENGNTNNIKITLTSNNGK